MLFDATLDTGAIIFAMNAQVSGIWSTHSCFYVENIVDHLMETSPRRAIFLSKGQLAKGKPHVENGSI